MKKRMLPNVIIIFFALVLLVAVPGQAWLASSPSGAGGSYTPAVMPNPGDWPMYGYDISRTNHNPAETTLNAGNVNQMVQRWQQFVGSNGTATSAAPSVANGVVYAASSAATGTNNMYAFNAGTGATVWAEQIGYRSSCFNVGIGSTPAISGTLVVVGKDPSTANPAYNGIDTVSGTIVWTNTMGVGASGFPWASAFLFNNKAYVGISSRCDNPSVRGELRAIDMTTGNTVGSAFFVNVGEAGGGIWNSAALSPDGSKVAVGTGEDYSCAACTYTRAMVTLDSNSLNILGYHQEPSPSQDLDFGTTPVIFHDSQNRVLVAAGHKNGTFYAYDTANVNAGAIWTRGGGTTVGLMPAYDPNYGNGGTLFIVTSSIVAVDPANGGVRWGPVSIGGSHGNIAIANGLIFVNRGASGLDIRDETNGSLIRTIVPPNPGAANSGVAVSNGFVYWLSGSYVNAWSLPAGGTPSATSTQPPPTNTPTATNTVPTATGTPTFRPCTLTPTGTPPATPGPCQQVSVRLFNETFNNGSLGAFSSTVVLTNTGGWTPVVDSVTCFVDYSAFAPDPPSVSDQRLTLINPINIPASYTGASLVFFHNYGFEQVGSQYNDGGVLELSTDNGSTWFDAGPYFTFGGYNGTITRTGATCGGITPPFTNGQSAWVGTNSSNTGVNLQAFIGMNLLFRFRLGSDCTGGSTGWHIDDITLTGTYINACTPSPTRTGQTIPPFTPTRTPTYTPTNTPTITPGGPTNTNTPTYTPTITPGGPTLTWTATNTPTITPGGPPSTDTPVVTPTACPIQFTDVPVGSPFYTFIRCLACMGLVNGYPDGTFRPNNNVTRGQLSKIVSNAAGFNEPAAAQMFEDVPPGSTFYDYVYRLASREYIQGYPCGGPGEPCVPPGDLPYFRPNNNATRGQISKIVNNAAGYSEPAGAQIFEDVAPGSTFYDFIWRLANRGIMSGYPCGNPEPCVPPGNRPYFRPNNNATRGQTSKIVANTFFPGCDPPRRR